MTRLKIFAIAAAMAGGLGLASAASAAPLPASPGLGDAAGIETVAFGCGPGFTRGRFGGCRPGFGRFGYGPRPGYGPRRFHGGRGFYRGGPRPFRRF